MGAQNTPIFFCIWREQMRGFDFQENRGYLGFRGRWMNHPMVLSCQLLSGLWYVIAIRVYRNLTFWVLKCYKPLAMGDARPSTAKDVSGLIPSLLCSCLRISLVLSTHLLAWLGPCYSERKKQDHQPTAAEKQDLAGDFCWIAERRTRKPSFWPCKHGFCYLDPCVYPCHGSK